MAVDKEMYLERLAENLGNVSHTTKEFNITRQTHYDWCKDPEFKKKVDEVNESCIDFVESKLFELINGVAAVGANGAYKRAPDNTSCIFYLKTKGKNRGYVERREVTGKDGKDIYEGMTDDQIQKEIDKLQTL